MVRNMLYIWIVLGSISAHCQDEWKNGHYYDLKGQSHYGLIKYSYDFKPSIQYKSNESSKPKTIKSWKSKGFVVGLDSFTVVKNFKILYGQEVAHDFAEVIEVGTLVLLRNYSRISQGGSPQAGGIGMTLGSSQKVQTYIITKPDSDKLWIVLKKKKKFEQLIKDLTKDFPEDSKFKKMARIDYESIPEIVREYNRLNPK